MASGILGMPTHINMLYRRQHGAVRNQESDEAAYLSTPPGDEQDLDFVLTEGFLLGS